MTIIFDISLYYNLIFFIALTIIITWLVTQSFKVFLKCWIGRRFSFYMIFSDGDFPSTHTALVTCGLVLIIFLNWYSLNIADVDTVNAYNSAKDFLIMFTLTSIVIRDAIGQRHRQDNTNKNLKNLKDYIKEFGVERNVLDHIDATFQSIDNEAIKKVGHLKHEVYGGAILGTICALYLIMFFFKMWEWLSFLIPISLIYFFGIILFLKLKPVVIKKITYRKFKNN